MSKILQFRTSTSHMFDTDKDSVILALRENVTSLFQNQFDFKSQPIWHKHQYTYQNFKMNSAWQNLHKQKQF